MKVKNLVAATTVSGQLPAIMPPEAVPRCTQILGRTTDETAVGSTELQAQTSYMRPGDVLHVLRCGSHMRRNRQDAFGYIKSLGRETAQSLFSRGLKRKTLGILQRVSCKRRIPTAA